jgi:hypothetical protein
VGIAALLQETAYYDGRIELDLNTLESPIPDGGGQKDIAFFTSLNQSDHGIVTTVRAINVDMRTCFNKGR